MASYYLCATKTVIMSKEYMLLSMLGILMGVPIVWYGLSEWLMTFAVRIEVTVLLFLIPCVGVALLTLLVISYQTVKAALTNPVETLRSE